MKLTIAGAGPGLEKTSVDVPIWCTSTAYKRLEALEKPVERIFQLHANDKTWEPWLKEVAQKVVLIRPDVTLFRAEQLPAQKLVEKYGFKFGSSIAWMLAYAIELEKYDEIYIHGVEMAHHTEYGTQRDTFFYFMGQAEARGIRVTISTNCALFIGDHVYGVV